MFDDSLRKDANARFAVCRTALHAAELHQDADIAKLIEFLKKEGGRTTQKDIRNEIPLSEAKISLMISELEHKGIIDKVKKGRGNIILLKKR